MTRARDRLRYPWITLALLLAVVWLGVRSYHAADLGAFFTRDGSVQGIAIHSGQILFLISDIRFPEARRLTFAAERMPASVFQPVVDMLRSRAAPVHARLGFEFGAGGLPDDTQSPPTSPIHKFTFAAAPFWFLAVLTQLPVLRLACRRRREARRGKQGRCLQCGYDLRATTTGRCPECGEPASDGARAIRGNTEGSTVSAVRQE